MTEITRISGDLTANKGRYGIIVTRWNAFIVEHLLSGALDTLQRHGVVDDAINVVYCPGAFEMPLVAQKMASSNRFDAIIALGAVIRGGTPHFEYVASECVKGLSMVQMDAGIPVTFGVLTVDNIEQAIERAGTKAGNKGAEAAIAAFEMVNLMDKLTQL